MTEIANTSSSLTISWSDPECELRGGYFVRYDVIFSSLSQNYSSVVRFKEVAGLQTYTEYKVQIAYVNTKGAGPLTVQQPFKTGEEGIKRDFFVLLSFTSTLVHHRFLVGSMLLILLVFYVVLGCVSVSCVS